MHDWVIRGGAIVDGTGRAARTADVAIDGERITAVGRVGPGRKEVDADGLLVTPGFVDVHTHYDAQVTWDARLSPSSHHGVTTVVMGNCGVGFAPAKPDKHDWLIGLMEGVEDIPGAAMHEGIEWQWETFEAYLTAIESKARAIDFGAYLPHAPLRAYVMGERSLDGEATPEDIEAMVGHVRRALAAGAMGFSTSRTLLHKSIDGEPVPGTFAGRAELFGIGGALAEAGHGVFQMAIQHQDLLGELGWAEELARATKRPVMFNLSQVDDAPELWRDAAAVLDRAGAEGTPLFAQVAGRAIGIVMGFHLTAHPFALKPSFLQIMHESPKDKQRALSSPGFLERLLAEDPLELGAFETFVTTAFEKMYPMGPDFDYEPYPSESIAAIAASRGRSPAELALEVLMSDDGNGQLYFPLFNYSSGHLDHLHALHRHERTVMGLSDAGAHCGAICDGGMPTFMLAHWTRDRRRGPKLSLEHVVHRQTQSTAWHFGLTDRGVLAEGKLADVNVIDYGELGFGRPQVVYDLPAGGRRLLQHAKGYRATFKRGEPIIVDDRPTDHLPGRLLRGGRSR